MIHVIEEIGATSGEPAVISSTAKTSTETSRKPREWWIEPMKYGLCRMTEECSDSALWHVREIIE